MPGVMISSCWPRLIQQERTLGSSWSCRVVKCTPKANGAKEEPSLDMRAEGHGRCEELGVSAQGPPGVWGAERRASRCVNWGALLRTGNSSCISVKGAPGLDGTSLSCRPHGTGLKRPPHQASCPVYTRVSEIREKKPLRGGGISSYPPNSNCRKRYHH